MRATEMIEGMSYIDYGERLKLLRLPTLSYRRARGEMIEVWKHYHVHDPNVISQTFQRVGGKCIRSSASVLGMVSEGPIVLCLLSSPSRMEQPPSLSSGVGHYQYIQESFGQTLGRSSTEVVLPRNHTKKTCAMSDQDVEIEPQAE